MIDPSYIEEIDCGSFFDHIDDLLDFPADDADASVALTAGLAGNCNSLASLWPTESDSFPSSDSVFSCYTASHQSAGPSVPYEDTVQLEWLSNFVEDSFSVGSLTMKEVDAEPSSCTTKEDLVRNQFQTASPVSVLESSSSCSGEKAAPCGHSPEIYIPVPCGRARSKRARPTTFSLRPVMQLISPASFVGENTQPNNVPSKASLDSENFAESHPIIKKPKHASGEHEKKKKIKISFTLSAADTNHINAASQVVRKCMHCGITKTPQWRAGPMGPKTLCNACGVRYKSGRLFPEYRPAASPTFCPSLHSNSHKKVLEMRTKTGEKSGFAMDSAALPEHIPNTNSSLTLEYM